ncbi:MAG: hypothetical protein QM790_20055 [Nibricoccus sp.]
MKKHLTLSLAVAFGSLLTISSSHAEPIASDNNSDVDAPEYGNLGHTYLALDTNLVKYRNATQAPTGYGADLKINMETTDHFDTVLGYRFNHAKNSRWQTTDQIAEFGVIGFYKFRYLAPYLGASSGYGWAHSKENFGKTSVSSVFHRAIYDVNTGVDVPVCEQTSVRLGVNYEQSFRSPHPTDWTYQASIDYKFDDTLGVASGVDYHDGRKGVRDSVVFHAGVCFTFD